MSQDQSRRELMRSATVVVAAVTVPGVILLVRPSELRAAPSDMQAAIHRVTGGVAPQAGRVKLEIPPLSENGNTVAITVTVESPMTATDYVKAIHVFNEKNPQPHVISARMGPRAGQAMLQTRARLSDTQTIVAVAELSDGSFWTDSTHVIVTLGACLEEPS